MIGSIFLEPWWLEAVTDDSYTLCSVNRGKHEKARLAFMKTRSSGLTRAVMPPLTQFAGPWMETTDAKYARRLSYQKDLIETLISEFPDLDTLNLNLDPSCMNGLPFNWKGFSSSVGYTYIIRNGHSEDEVRKGMLPNIYKSIKKAKQIVNVRESDDLPILLDQVDRTFKAKDKERRYSRNALVRLDYELHKRSQRKLLIAEDDQGNVHSAAYFVWNGNAMHYLLGGGDPSLRQSGSSALLLWIGIQHAIAMGLTFNFEGSMIEGVERFYRSFGAEQVPYLRISCESRRAVCYRLVREAVTLVRGKGK